ncbi:conjugative transposon protein TraJ [Mucilaginibacter pineti]|nr:conjugative transposon protein TraJ [Mucilaginibacter pineti]
MTILLAGIASLAQAQEPHGVAGKIKGLEPVLDTIFHKMIKLSSKLINVSSGIAGFGALFFIGSRIWKSLAAAEPIDFYPLLRPFVLGLCIAMFPAVLDVLNGLLQPTVNGTAAMLEDSNAAVRVLLQKQNEAIKKGILTGVYTPPITQEEQHDWDYAHAGTKTESDKQSEFGMQSQFQNDAISSWMANTIKRWISEILQLLFEAAALCINTVRTFQLVVLAILGPVVFGFAVFDGFQHTLTAWLAKYINIFLWLPVCNIFGTIISTIQAEMLKIDVEQMAHTGTSSFGLSDAPYLIFMIIGIVGYMTVPTIAGYIINAGGAGAMVQKMTSMVSSAGSGAMNRMASAPGNIADARQHLKDGKEGTKEDSQGRGVAGAMGRMAGSMYQANKLSGNQGEKQ